MNNLNSVLIEGTLTKNAVTGTTPKGMAVCAFTIESDRYHKGEAGIEKEAGFFDVQAFGKLAEYARNLAHAGRGVRVIGRLKQDSRISFDGKTVSRIIIEAEHIEYRPEFADRSPAAEEAQQEEA